MPTQISGGYVIVLSINDSEITRFPSGEKITHGI